MAITNFAEMVKCAQSLKVCRRVALAGAHDAHSVEAVVEAEKEGIVVPVLVGNRAKVVETLEKLGLSAAKYDIIDSGDENPGKFAAEAIRDGKADFLMKGGIETKDIMKPVLDKNNGLTTGRVLSGYAIAEIPNYHKLISHADGAMLLYPDAKQKKETIINTVELVRKLGIDEPKVAVLCAVETVNPKMIETLDAQQLVEWNKAGEIPNCKVVGPISYDLIMSKESAEIKGYDCPYCGDFDIIISATIAAANTLTKCWAYSANAVWAGLILGAKMPIVLVSRGSSAQEKFLSLALAAVTSGGNE